MLGPSGPEVLCMISSAPHFTPPSPSLPAVDPVRQAEMALFESGKEVMDILRQKHAALGTTLESMLQVWGGWLKCVFSGRGVGDTNLNYEIPSLCHPVLTQRRDTTSRPFPIARPIPAIATDTYGSHSVSTPAGTGFPLHRQTRGAAAERRDRAAAPLLQGLNTTIAKCGVWGGEKLRGSLQTRGEK